MRNPEPGMGASLQVGSDLQPYTITRVSSTGTRIYAKPCRYRRTDDNGISEDQTYEFWDQDDAPEVTFTLRADGEFRQANRNSGIFAWDGHRAYEDPSF